MPRNLFFALMTKCWTNLKLFLKCKKCLKHFKIQTTNYKQSNDNGNGCFWLSSPLESFFLSACKFPTYLQAIRARVWWEFLEQGFAQPPELFASTSQFAQVEDAWKLFAPKWPKDVWCTKNRPVSEEKTDHQHRWSGVKLACALKSSFSWRLAWCVLFLSHVSTKTKLKRDKMLLTFKSKFVQLLVTEGKKDF